MTQSQAITNKSPSDLQNKLFYPECGNNSEGNTVKEKSLVRKKFCHFYAQVLPAV